MIRFRSQNYFCCLIGMLLLIAPTGAMAQPLSFIHIQTENDQPYEVAWNGKNYSSSPKGYLVIPQVPAGKHVLNLSYSDETGTTTEYQFTVGTEGTPRGFSLRQAIDNSWALFDMVDLTLLKGTVVEPVVKAEVPDVIPAPVKESAPVQKPAEMPAGKKEPVITKEKASLKPTGILKIFDKTGSSGIDQVYVITNGTKSDTIALFIPVIEKNEPGTGSNPSAFFQYPVSFHDNAGQTILARPRYLLALSK